MTENTEKYPSIGNIIMLIYNEEKIVEDKVLDQEKYIELEIEAQKRETQIEKSETKIKESEQKDIKKRKKERKHITILLKEIEKSGSTIFKRMKQTFDNQEKDKVNKGKLHGSEEEADTSEKERGRVKRVPDSGEVANLSLYTHLRAQ